VSQDHIASLMARPWRECAQLTKKNIKSEDTTPGAFGSIVGLLVIPIPISDNDMPSDPHAEPVRFR